MILIFINNKYECIFQLPYEITGVELKDTFILVIDKYKNQIGLDADRCFYVLSRIDVSMGGEFYKQNMGLKMFATLMGLKIPDIDIIDDDEYNKDFFDNFKELNRYQSKIITDVTLSSGKKYILYQIQLVKSMKPIFPTNFVIINKKKIKKIKVENKIFDDNDYYDDIVMPTLGKIIVNMCWYICYTQSENVEIRESKGSRKNVYIVRPKL